MDFLNFPAIIYLKFPKEKKLLLGKDSLEFMFIADFTQLIASSIIQIGV